MDVNAYTLTFAVFLLTGAALGDRFGRKRLFMSGSASSRPRPPLAALAPSTDWLIAARAFQGFGAAIVTPLMLTILSAAVPADERGLALGAWSGIAGLAVATSARRWRRRRRHRVAVDLLAERARRARSPPARTHVRESPGPTGRSTSPASLSAASACSASSGAWSRQR